MEDVLLTDDLHDADAAPTDAELLKATRPYMEEQRGRSWFHLGTTLVVLGGLLTVTTLNLHWAIRGCASLVAGWVAVRLFILYHDFQHGAIFRGSPLAKLILHTYGMLTLSPSSPWNRSHNYHHAHNSQILGASIGSYPIMTVEAYARAGRSTRFAYSAARHPLTIFMGYLTVFLYGMCLRPFWINPRQHWDCAVAILVQAAIVASLAVFNPLALLFTLGLPLFLASAIGAYLFYAQHNFPDVKLKPRSEWTHVFSSKHSSSYMKLSPVMHWFTGNIGYHHVHHLNPRIPFYRLPEAMAAITELQSPGTTSLSLREIRRCLRLKLWDPDQGRMVTFRGEAV